jgi:SprT protein
MNLVKPIDPDRQARVVEAVNGFIRVGESHYGRSFAAVPVLFDLKGKTSGMYRVRGRERVIRFNPWIFAKHYRESLASTVPHEVAHYLTDRVYGLHRIRPHGREWRELMAAFGADARVTSDYSLEGIPRRNSRRYAYRCECRSHELSAIRHNRVQRGQAQYQCRYCGSRLWR